MTHKPPFPTGYAWSCPCGWSTGRSQFIEIVDIRRAGHERHHALTNETRKATA